MFGKTETNNPTFSITTTKLKEITDFFFLVLWDGCTLNENFTNDGEFKSFEKFPNKEEQLRKFINFLLSKQHKNKKLDQNKKWQQDQLADPQKHQL